MRELILHGAALAKNVAASCGVAGVLYGAYTASGLPVPATIAQVEQRVEKVTKRIDGLTVDQLQGQRAIIRLSRISLRNELTALQRILDTATTDTGLKTTLTRRQGEIGDQLKELDDQDGELRTRINKLSDGKPA